MTGQASYHKRITLVPIPRAYKALIEQEMDKTGSWNFADVMGRILSAYFGPQAVDGSASVIVERAPGNTEALISIPEVSPLKVSRR